jgi:hypothetical protein
MAKGWFLLPRQAISRRRWKVHTQNWEINSPELGSTRTG